MSTFVLVGSLLFAVSCGDDDAGTASVCESRDDLTSSITALGDVNVVSEGTDGLETAADDVRASLDQLRQAAGDEYGDEVDAVQAALENLGDALRSVDDQPTASERVSAVADAATQLRDSATVLGDQLRDECN